MAKKTPIDKLQDNIKKILEEYGHEISEASGEAVQQTAKAGAAALRTQSRQTFGGSGDYAKGWTANVEESRMTTTAVIYNKTPGLPHLLENGHANRGGGRTPGRPHIAPVEEEIVASFTKEVEKAL